MNCNVMQDLIPLYIDGCCSEESTKIVNEHIKGCRTCKRLVEDLSAQDNLTAAPEAPIRFRKLNDWKASILQSVSLFLSFAMITTGVALEAKTPSGLTNGFWAANLVIPATGFMLSLANWYFVRVYRNRKHFSNYSLTATLGITLCAYLWSGIHYGATLSDLFTGDTSADVLETLCALLLRNGTGILLTAVFCILSKVLSNQYAKMLGKE